MNREGPKETLSREEWLAGAKRRFGPDPLKWKFKCPVCGHIQTPEDFRPYKDKGATPDSAATECLGRYAGAKSTGLSGKAQPCDYAGYGFFRLNPVHVSDGPSYGVFAFAD